MDETVVLEYIPVIGDIYRYAKLGYTVGSWVANADNDYNDRVLSDMIVSINNASDSSDEFEAINYINEAVEAIHSFKTDNCKKYQLALLLYLSARVFHILALCGCMINKYDLKGLKEVKSTFDQAHNFCTKVWNVDKTIFTANRSMIDEIRKMAAQKTHEIIDSKKQWRKQYRFLYKQIHPIKWYMGMWMFV